MTRSLACALVLLAACGGGALPNGPTPVERTVPPKPPELPLMPKPPEAKAPPAPSFPDPPGDLTCKTHACASGQLLYDCVDANGGCVLWTDNTHVFRCSQHDEYLRGYCAAGQATAPQPPLACAGYLGCQLGCPQGGDNSVCLSACVQHTGQKAEQAYSDAIQCANDVCRTVSRCLLSGNSLVDVPGKPPGDCYKCLASARIGLFDELSTPHDPQAGACKVKVDACWENL
jgi:hypothetical protein